MFDFYQHFLVPHSIFFLFIKSMLDLYQHFSVHHPTFCFNKSIFDFYQHFSVPHPIFLVLKNLCLTCINTFLYLTPFFCKKNLCWTCINNFQYLTLLLCYNKSMFDLYWQFFNTTPYFLKNIYVWLLSTLFSTSLHFFLLLINLCWTCINTFQYIILFFL